MVKKWIIMLSIIAVLIVSCVLESNFVNHSFVFLEDELKKYKEVIQVTPESEINSEKNILYIEDLHSKWHEKLKGLKCLIWHSGIKDVEVGLSRILTYTTNQDKTETLAEVNSLIDYLNHYSEDFTIAIENIL